MTSSALAEGTCVWAAHDVLEQSAAGMDTIDNFKSETKPNYTMYIKYIYISRDCSKKWTTYLETQVSQLAKKISNLRSLEAAVGEFFRSTFNGQFDMTSSR